ncbi:MAG: 4'-phosphopantetheinyl transferase superfamily protein [Limnohabitans sp.]|jgi:4'-phosphopantetheinyl transferase EntD|nr:4'-phosphopantetheinyl transferase superfamily protein [Limnohabitans sp.]
MTRIARPSTVAFPVGSVLAEYDARHPKRLAQDEPTLPAEERALAASIRSLARRTGFIAGRIALHAALAESDARAFATRPVLRDARGRPTPSWDCPPPLSIAHSRARAVAVVTPRDACVAIGIDVEELDEHRAHALVRMSLSEAEICIIRACDASLVAGPIAVWCARESCVKAHALDVGWFGTALVTRNFEPCAAPINGAIHAWRITLSFEDRSLFHATAWTTAEAVFACAVREHDA